MKKFLFLIALFFISCSDYEDDFNSPQTNVATSFTSTEYKDICRYYVTTYGESDYQTFRHGSVGNMYKYENITFLDSVDKFKIGDTIIFSKK